MKRDIVLIYKGDPSEVPVLIYVSRICLDLECRVIVICGYCNPITKSELVQIGVRIIALDSRQPQLRRTRIAKLAYWARFRSFVKSALKDSPKNCVVWLGSGDTAIALYGLKFNNPFVLHLHELYDDNYFYRLALEKVSRQATAIVCPEKNRAAIVQVWFALKNSPFVLPNRPYSHPRKQHLLAGNALVAPVQELIAGRKVLLYQGHIGSDRSFSGFARVIGTISDRWALIVMGKSHDGTLDLLRAACPSLIYIQHIIPPGHLAVTSLATIGVIRYMPSSLNNIFCAPNKIWEYAGYGIPFISNRLPALEDILSKYKCGICVDDIQEDILSALNTIECSYDDYSIDATKFFDSVDPRAIVRNIIQQCPC